MKFQYLNVRWCANEIWISWRNLLSVRYLHIFRPFPTYSQLKSDNLPNNSVYKKFYRSPRELKNFRQFSIISDRRNKPWKTAVFQLRSFLIISPKTVSLWAIKERDQKLPGPKGTVFLHHFRYGMGFESYDRNFLKWIRSFKRDRFAKC